MIQFENVTFAYSQSEFRLDIPAFSVTRGEKVALIGPSGSGKTTLLHLAAGILAPSGGTIRLDGVPISELTDAEARSFRIARIGLVFQEFELLEYLSVRENILLPYRINPALKLTKEVRHAAQSLARAVGIEETLDRYPHRLSHGERQRVAISRALIARPSMILADEPTGNLDPHNSQIITDLLLQSVDTAGATLLTVTHDHSLLDRFDRVIDFAQWQSRRPAEVVP